MFAHINNLIIFLQLCSDLLEIKKEKEIVAKWK